MQTVGSGFGGVQVHSSRNSQSVPQAEGLAYAQDHVGQHASLSAACSRFGRQVWALTRKNLLLLWRNRASTFIRLGSCILFMLLMFCIIGAINVTIGNESHVRNDPSPKSEDIPGIIKCERANCISLAYVPAPSNEFVPDKEALDDAVLADFDADKRASLERVHKVVRSVLTNNKDEALDPQAVRGFVDEKAMDDYIVSHQGDVQCGVVLASPSAEGTRFVLQVNITADTNEEWAEVDEKNKKLAKELWMPVQVEFSKAIGREMLGAADLDIDLAVQPFAHPPAAKPPPIESSDMAPLFLFAAALFPFVMQMSEVVTEREQKLRQTLHVMGMMDSAYWVSWHLFHIATGLLGALVLCVAGIAFRYELFVNNDFGVLFFTFFFYSLAMTGLAYMLSTMLRTAGHALVVGICFFFVGFILYFVVLFGVPWKRFPAKDEDFYFNCTAEYVWDFSTNQQVSFDNYTEGSDGFRVARAACSELPAEYADLARYKVIYNSLKSLPGFMALIPPTLLTKTLADLGDMANPDKATGGHGLHMQNVSSYCAHNFTSGEICDDNYSVGSSWGIWFGLYLFYSIIALYLDNVLPDAMGVRKPPWYFAQPAYWGLTEASIQSEGAEAVEASEDKDVKAEELLLRQRTGQPMAPSSAVEVRGLRKEFIRNGNTFHAVKGLQLAMDKQQLFALLGPNGAGKTTLINMLIGVVPPTAGEALVNGHPVAHPAGMARIRQQIGVCPQFDVLWESLTAEEHLTLLADIKGLVGSVADECARRLTEVRLSEVAKQPAGTFSGGMKRRLSVAMSLIGDPKVLFLDEPTTGMDPVSRRCVWDVIEVAKQNRAVVLTTHSMEEADILADRIGIIAKTRVEVAGYSLAVGVKHASTKEAVKAIFQNTLQVKPDAEGSAHLSFKVPDGKELALPTTFAFLEEPFTAAALEGVQLSMSSLEDVFLRIAKDADAADAEQRRVLVTLRGGETVEVQVGSEEIQSSANGGKFKCVWGMDDAGNLACLSTVELRQVTLRAQAPLNAGPGTVVEVHNNGVPHQLTVPAGVAPGQVFTHDVWVEAGEETGVAVPVQGGNSSAGTYGLSAEELAQRVDRLAASFSSQSKAIFHKSLAVQKRRWGSNVMLCVCPALCIALVFIMQILVESVWDPAVESRCTYCGPSDDVFGKSYCGGKSCIDFFFPEQERSDDMTWACPGISPGRCWEMVKAICEDKAENCGGKGHPDCFWPGAPGSLGYECDAYSDAQRDHNSATSSALALLRSLGFEDAEDPKADEEFPGSGAPQQWSLGYPVVDMDHVFKKPEALPLMFAPEAPFLAEAPVLYTGSEGVAEKVMEKVLSNPLGKTAGRERAETAGRKAVQDMFTLLALPSLGCGTMSQDGTAVPIADLPEEAEEAICALLQHDRVRNGGLGDPEPCCLDLTVHDDSPLFGSPEVEGRNVWSAGAGVKVVGSGRGQQHVKQLLSRLLDQDFASTFMATGNLADSSMRCVLPRYTEELQRRLGDYETVGLEEGLAVLQNVLSLPLSVHPEVEPNRAVPECVKDGNCETPNGRWAQECDRQLWEAPQDPAQVNGDGDPYRGVFSSYPSTSPAIVQPACGLESQQPCVQAFPHLLPSETAGSGSLALPSCLCVYAEVVRQLAALELGMLTGSSRQLTSRPELPFDNATVTIDGEWAKLAPFGLPGLTVTSSLLDRPTASTESTNLDAIWEKMSEFSGDRWWTLNVDLRYATCSCQTGGTGGLTCKQVERNGEGDCLKTWDGCEWQEDCNCASEAADGYPQRKSYSVSNFDLEGQPDGQTGPDVPEGAEDGCYRDLVLALEAQPAVLQVLVEDCSELEAIHQLLHLTFNVTKLRFECVPLTPKTVTDHAALDAALYQGHFKRSDDPRPRDSLPGVALAVDFHESSETDFALTVMLNETSTCSRWTPAEECPGRVRPIRHLATINTILTGVIAQATGTSSGPMMLGLKAFPASPEWGDSFDLGSEYGPFLFTFTFLVLFPSIVVTLVQEKVFKIRIMMRMMGLSGTAFWTITYAFWFVIFVCFSSVFLFVVNVTRTHTSGYRIGMFANVHGGVQVMFFLGYMLCTISFSVLWSTLIRSIRVAQVVTVLWIIVLVVLAFVFDSVGDIFNSDGISAGMKTFLSLFPPLGFFRGLTVFRRFASTHDSPNPDGSGLNWGSVHETPIPEILTIQFLESIIFMAIALYFDQVLDSDFGVPRHPLWCLGLKRTTGGHVKGVDHMDGAKAGGSSQEPEDVAAERLRVENMSGKPATEQDAVMTFGLQKVYEGNPPKEAVKPLTMAVRRGECFGMLGPNGAGKTTTINMLVGFSQPSAGQASVEGLSILDEMHRIYTIMGVCPQHDLLWMVLTAREHLYFYGRLKNLEGEALREATEEALRSVNLLDVIDTQAGTYSGGMKRRLSVAISLIGAPLVCYLDEPSTGLDPASRRLLWECVKQAKRSRAVLLTTHSMEEAEGLCDRLGIFVDGRLRCIGAPKELTLRFGGIFVLTIVTTSSKEKAASAVVTQLCPTATLTYSLAGTRKYELPWSHARLSSIFATMTQQRQQGAIISWGISSATLEDAFIKIANARSEGETAAPEEALRRVSEHGQLRVA